MPESHCGRHWISWQEVYTLFWLQLGTIEGIWGGNVLCFRQLTSASVLGWMGVERTWCLRDKLGGFANVPRASEGWLVNQKGKKEEERWDFVNDLTWGLGFRVLGVIKNQEVRGGGSSGGMLMFCYKTRWVWGTSWVPMWRRLLSVGSPAARSGTKF